MMSVHKLHYFYLRPGHLPVVHSPISDKPFQVIIVVISLVFRCYEGFNEFDLMRGGDRASHETMSKILFLCFV